MGIWGSSDYFHFTITFGTLITKDAEYSTLTGVELMYGSNNPTLVPCLVTNNVSNFFNGRENNLQINIYIYNSLEYFSYCTSIFSNLSLSYNTFYYFQGKS